MYHVHVLMQAVWCSHICNVRKRPRFIGSFSTTTDTLTGEAYTFQARRPNMLVRWSGWWRNTTYYAICCTCGHQKHPEENKVPRHRLQLFNLLTLRIYEHQDSSGAPLLRLQHVSQSVMEAQTTCSRCVHVCQDVIALRKRNENISSAGIFQTMHLSTDSPQKYYSTILYYFTITYVNEYSHEKKHIPTNHDLMSLPFHVFFMYYSSHFSLFNCLQFDEEPDLTVCLSVLLLCVSPVPDITCFFAGW